MPHWNWWRKMCRRWRTSRTECKWFNEKLLLSFISFISFVVIITRYGRDGNFLGFPFRHSLKLNRLRTIFTSREMENDFALEKRSKLHDVSDQYSITNYAKKMENTLLCLCINLRDVFGGEIGNLKKLFPPRGFGRKKLREIAHSWIWVDVVGWEWKHLDENRFGYNLYKSTKQK